MTLCVRVFFLCFLILVSSPLFAVATKHDADRAFKEGDYSKAKSEYSLLLQNDPSFKLYCKLGDTCVKLRDWQEASKAYQKALELGKENSDPRLLAALGKTLFMTGNVESALEVFRKIKEANLQKRDLWIARCLVDKNRWTRAVTVLLKFTEENSDNKEALEMLAHIYSETNRLHESADIYKRLIRLTPETKRYVTNLAAVKVKSKQPKKAIDILEFYCRMYAVPDGDWLRMLADLYASEKMYYQAVQSYEHLITLGMAKKETYTRLAALYSHIEQWDKAEKIYKKMAVIASKDGQIPLALGNIHTRQGELEKARSDYQKAIKMDPNSPDACLSLADLEIRETNFKIAAAMLEEALDRGETSLEVYCNLVFCLIKSKQMEQAKSRLKEAFGLFSKHEDLDRILTEYIQHNSSIR